MRSIIAVAVAVLAIAPAAAEAAPTVRAAKAETVKLAALQARELDKIPGLQVERYTVGNCYSYTRRVTCFVRDLRNLRRPQLPGPRRRGDGLAAALLVVARHGPGPIALGWAARLSPVQHSSA